ncbi:2-succinyl-5-enolpyruvyl-6-hydroxy-3-cyclohexene-1-carboxylate synthase [Gulosibacter sp. 10]|uniref:2-succinyl-5-enolpyruvyl-6-hydroxy-3- cyclohexene-1-carboxylate synthase n=1 Tax=Gulosibacter sp. 10 TaxID=1255570 RepID=UPI00097F5587|nr:2-succinyl-5-enolpyruvyl-6-hydroxy-3-cyclohexene-1-carboxylate synthase [Gulosibacter sp. 10]SJM56009.1 2-succinyl-5-enolpyruvyl-6-hydroxy-3-cyclohexene-1-carboxylic-acid synthase [Gulosibacter sp. 10]
MTPGAPGSPALDASIELLLAAVERGVRDIVVCPGSRSQALALVAAELERIGAARLHVRIDERSAAFFALGIARESDRPVPVITTSGTAVANLAPAMLEALHAGVPLVALTADRPEELQGTGANQTTRQPGLFGPEVPVVSLPAPTGAEPDLYRAAGAAIADARGAWHCNVAFREPLSGPVPDLSARMDGAVRLLGAGGEDAGLPAPRTLEAWPGKDGDRRIRDGEPGRGLPAELAAAISDDLAAHAGPGAVGAPADGTPGSVPALDAAPLLEFGALPPLRGTATGGASAPASAEPAPAIEIDPAEWPDAVVVAGDRAGELGERLARQGGWPLIAEVSSGSRFGRNAIAHYRALLGANSPVPALRDAIELVIVVGHPTLSREVPDLLGREGVRVVAVDQPGAPRFRPHERVEAASEVRVLAFGSALPAGSAKTAPLREEAEARLHDWIAADRRLQVELDSDPEAPDVRASRSADFRERARFGRAELAVSREPASREMLVDSVWRLTWPHDRLHVAASRLIRDLDSRVPGKRIRVHANRGLAGIDGTIASGLGVAHASQHGEHGPSRTGTTRVLMGDLAFLHDAGSLLVGQGGEDAPRIQIVVGNDGGGTIFDSLEVASSARAEAFDRVQFTPREADIRAIAEAYGWAYRRATTRGTLEEALTDRTERLLVIEVPLPR